jgi:hypothetical protein
VVGFAICAPYATTVALIQSKVGLTVFHFSVTGTSFQRIACNEKLIGDKFNEMLI